MEQKYNQTSLDIDIVEGTTRYINISVVDKKHNPLNLTEYDATMCIKRKMGGHILKNCEVTDNEIDVRIDPEDSLNQYPNTMDYEIRIYKDNEVFSVVSGVINVTKSIHPYTKMPLVNTGNGGV